MKTFVRGFLLLGLAVPPAWGAVTVSLHGPGGASTGYVPQTGARLELAVVVTADPTDPGVAGVQMKFASDGLLTVIANTASQCAVSGTTRYVSPPWMCSQTTLAVPVSALAGPVGPRVGAIFGTAYQDDPGFWVGGGSTTLGYLVLDVPPALPGTSIMVRPVEFEAFVISGDNIPADPTGASFVVHMIASDDPDTDGDQVPDSVDNCRFAPNPTQLDSDLDGEGDACDLCAGSPDTLDADGDLIPDACDTCPLIYDPDNLDSNHDGVGDICSIQISGINAFGVVTSTWTKADFTYANSQNANVGFEYATTGAPVNFTGTPHVDASKIHIVYWATINGTLQPPASLKPLEAYARYDWVFMNGLFLPEASCAEIIVDADFIPGYTVLGDRSIRFKRLAGDLNADSVVDVQDMQLVKQKAAEFAGRPIPQEFRFWDFQKNGVLDLGDALYIRSRLSDPPRTVLCP